MPNHKAHAGSKDDNIRDMAGIRRLVLYPEKQFFLLAIIYGLGIGLLTLAVPISVQALLNTVINTALPHFILLLSIILFMVLLISSVLTACRDYAMELFQRRFMARLAAEVSLRITHSDQRYMQGINRAELVNRFFEIMHVQKNVPNLLAEGFFIALQCFVGVVAVSFYHPFLFVYNVLFLGSLYCIWKIWSGRARQQAIALSDGKYVLVQWLEELARVNKIFKSENTIRYALKKTDSCTAHYLKEAQAFFRSTFSQNLGFLFLYSIASASLLGLGGLLVTRNELTLGQLVGAELIMSAVFYGISKLGYYCRVYYELSASVHKLGYFFRLPLEQNKGTLLLGNTTFGNTPLLSFQQVSGEHRKHPFFMDFSINSGEKWLAGSAFLFSSQIFVDSIKSYRSPEQGQILVAGQALEDYELHHLRSKFLAVDSFGIAEGTIRECFHLYSPEATQAEIMAFLALVELDDVIQHLPDGLDTRISPSGYPLLQEEIVRLKLAALLLAKPSLLVITEVMDTVPHHRRERILMRLCEDKALTFICFTLFSKWEFFDHYLFMDENGSAVFDDAKQFQSCTSRYMQEIH